MLKNKKKYLIIYLFPFLISSDEEIRDTIKWSDFQGKKTWQEAKDLCKSMKMRLPTISELKIAEETGTTIGWIKYGTKYWSVNKNLETANSTFKVYSILGLEGDKNEENHKINSIVGVFCANVTFESNELDVIRELVENNATESEMKNARKSLLAKRYSDYKGKLTWDDANRKCKKLKMRLPTIIELEEAYAAGILESWEKDGRFYWSSSFYDEERFYGLYVSDGKSFSESRNEVSHVRCRR